VSSLFKLLSVYFAYSFSGAPAWVYSPVYMAYVGPDLDLYHEILKSTVSSLERWVVFIGLLSFVVLQLFASNLGGSLAILIIQSPTAWTIISIVSWGATGWNFLFSYLECIRDIRKGTKLVDKDIERQEQGIDSTKGGICY